MAAKKKPSPEKVEKIIATIEKKLGDAKFAKKIDDILEEFVGEESDNDFFYELVSEEFYKVVETNEVRCRIREKIRNKLAGKIDQMVDEFCSDTEIAHY